MFFFYFKGSYKDNQVLLFFHYKIKYLKTYILNDTIFICEAVYMYLKQI